LDRQKTIFPDKTAYIDMNRNKPPDKEIVLTDKTIFWQI
jgi:hypothetical protein